MSTFQVFSRGFWFGIFFILLLEAALLYYGLQWFLKNGKLTKPENNDGTQDHSKLTKPENNDGTQDHSKPAFKSDQLDEKGAQSWTLSSQNQSSPPSQNAPGTAEKAQDINGQEWNLPWPEPIVEKLKRWLSPTENDDPLPLLNTTVNDINNPKDNNEAAPSVPSAMSKTVDAEWLNIIMNRLFLTLRSSKVFRNVWTQKVSSKMNMKLKENSFVSHISITNLRLGEHPPTFDGVRLMKGVSADLVLMGEVDITYRGGASIEIQTTLANGSVVPMVVFMNELKGTVRIRLPSEKWADMIGFAFVQDPGVTFRVESPLTGDNHMLQSMVNSVLSSLMRKTFLELWVLPNYRTAFIPLLEPKLDQWVKREAEAKALEATKKQKNTIAERATQLWAESTAPLGSFLKKPAEKIKDGLEGKSFDVTDSLPKSDLTETFNLPLIAAFTELVNEPLEEITRAKSLTGRLKFAQDDTENTNPRNSTDTASIDGQSLQSVPNSWKMIRNKNDITIQKKHVILDSDLVLDMNRATIQVSCDAARTFTILSNPLHFRHTYDSFIDSKSILDDCDGLNTAHTCTFQFSKGEQKFSFFQAKNVSESGDVRTVVLRSISGIEEETEAKPTESNMPLEEIAGNSTLRHRTGKTSNTDLDSSAFLSSKALKVSGSQQGSATTLFSGQVYVFGYQVVKVSETTCLVTVLSQFSSELQRLEIDFSFCRKLKLFIEELTHLTDSGEASNSTSVDSSLKRLFGGNEEKVKERLASYLGTAKSYLNRKKVEENTDSAVVDVGQLPASVHSLTDTDSAQASVVTESIEELSKVPYIERVIGSMEMSKVEIPFVRQNYGLSVTLKWEYVCRQEQCPNFGIHYIPNDVGNLNQSIEMIPYAGGNARILLPSSGFQCYSRPAFGSISLSDLNSGTIVLIWENNLGLKNIGARTIVYKTHFQGNSTSFPECNALVTIPRKSFVSIPIVFDRGLLERKDSTKLNIQFSTGGTIVPFALYFDELPTSNEGESTEKVPKKTLIPFSSSSKTGQTRIQQPIQNVPGLYTFQWDNSQSIVSSRQVDLKIGFI